MPAAYGVNLGRGSGIGIALALLLTGLAASGCVWVFQSVETEAIDPPEAPASVDSPVKLHLADGFVALYPNGFTLEDDVFVARDSSSLYNVRLEEVPFDGRLEMDRVLALETFREKADAGRTLFATVAATAVGVYGGALLIKALFGSCPTFYTVDDGEPTLQAESFSYSIASLFEKKDFDRIDVTPDEQGLVSLELRNEALETHYINQIELLEVVHGPGESAYPMDDGRALIVRGERPPSSARDTRGHSYVDTLSVIDDRVYKTHPARMDELHAGDLTDHLDLAWPAPEADSAALGFRVRNSLLNTVLFYDIMIAGQGVHALDWMNIRLNSIDAALEMGEFFRRHMGIRVFVMGPDGYERVGRIGGVGPIAWEAVAIRVPVRQRDSLRVRLEFLADSWRIDRVALGDVVSTVQPTRLPVSRLTGTGPGIDIRARDRLRSSDEEYLVTGPGQKYSLSFETTAEPEERVTFLLAAQGYYTEWVRKSWIEDNPDPPPLRLTDETLAKALDRWRARKAEFETQFMSSRIPVR